ncbi:unnamed protein product, partial [Durusdinium trenchii]
MAVREVSIHDSFRLLKTQLPELLEQMELWVPQTWPWSPELPLDPAVAAAPCSVMPDHLLSTEALAAAGLLARNLDRGQVQDWLNKHANKECIIDKAPKMAPKDSDSEGSKEDG